MGKALLGFLVGILLTTFAFVLVSRAPESSDPGPIANEYAASETLETSIDDQGPSDVPRGSAGIVVQNEPETTNSLSAEIVDSPSLADDQLRNLTEQELTQRVLKVEIARAQIALERRRRQFVAVWGNEPPPILPIVLPPEFDWLKEDPRNSHELLQREPYDPLWSATTEARLRTYIDEHPKFAEEYAYPTINCRTTKCEIAFVANYDVASDNPDVASLPVELRIASRFGLTIIGFAEHPVAEEFDYDPGSIPGEVHHKDGVTTILWHLQRKESD